MNCAEASQIYIVDYLFSLGHQPKKIRGQNHWYLSPLREEKDASFKVDKNKNVWYDHGTGEGGTLVDFATKYFRCDISEALKKLSLFRKQNHLKNNAERLPFQLPQNNFFTPQNATETAIKIIAAKPLVDLLLCRYLSQRKIDKNIAEKYCQQVIFKLDNQQKEHLAIGFKNNAGGYELRNEFFKGSSSPKYISYFDNNGKNISVFEGFFDFLSYQTIRQNQEPKLTNFLVLNSLSFFERSLLFMEKHESVHLYLDHDKAGRRCTDIALKRSIKFTDESKLYKGYKDLNDWIINFGKSRKTSQVKHSLKK
jgi:hypothetical protein